MGRTNIKQLFREPDKFLNRSVLISGWVRTVRSSKNFSFIELNDGSFFRNLQVVFDDQLLNYETISKLPVGSAITVEGEIVKSPGRKQPMELNASRIVVVGESALDYPLQKKRHSFEFLRTIAHLRPRSNTFMAVFRLRSILSYAIHKFFQERDFVYVHTPIITGSDCEGAGQMFKVTSFDLNNPPKNDKQVVDYDKDFFGKEAGLTVSGQLNVENFCMAFDRVYTFGPTFRAENSNTPRHASEFWMIEPEIAFADLEDNMELAEEMVKFIIGYALENASEEMNFFNRFIDSSLLERLNLVMTADFECIRYTEAIKILEKADVGFQYPVEWGRELQTEHERYLTEKVYKKPVFVIDYPKDIKAFYMRLNDDEKTVAAMDLLVPAVGEIIGGSQREERYDVLKRRIQEMGLNQEDYWWYLDLRKYGGTPHAGFGLGFARAVMYLTGMENIRDVIPFPRTPRNCEF